MRAERISSLVLAAIISLLTPLQALACACCSDEGEYYRSIGRIQDYELDLIRQMRFGSKAFLLSTEAGPEEDGRGLSNPKVDYALNGSMTKNSFRLTFRDGSQSGVLTLPIPINMENYKVDIHDGQQSGGGGPLVYKEWRLEGLVNGTGIFKPGLVGPTKYFLVLQGRGNNCDNAEDFTDWRVEIKGKKARYAFFGKLAKPS
jgi:hypothetical protein